jgi:hypothetical protein
MHPVSYSLSKMLAYQLFDRLEARKTEGNWPLFSSDCGEAPAHGAGAARTFI